MKSHCFTKLTMLQYSHIWAASNLLRGINCKAVVECRACIVCGLVIRLDRAILFIDLLYLSTLDTGSTYNVIVVSQWMYSKWVGISKTGEISVVADFVGFEQYMRTYLE